MNIWFPGTWIPYGMRLGFRAKDLQAAITSRGTATIAERTVTLKWTDEKGEHTKQGRARVMQTRRAAQWVDRFGILVEKGEIEE